MQAYLYRTAMILPVRPTHPRHLVCSNYEARRVAIDSRWLPSNFHLIGIGDQRLKALATSCRLCLPFLPFLPFLSFFLSRFAAPFLTISSICSSVSQMQSSRRSSALSSVCSTSICQKQTLQQREAKRWALAMFLVVRTPSKTVGRVFDRVGGKNDRRRLIGVRYLLSRVHE